MTMMIMQPQEYFTYNKHMLMIHTFLHSRLTIRPEMYSEMQLMAMTLQNVHHLHAYQILASEMQHAWNIETSGAADVQQGNTSH
jgi:hypothetical protein